MRFFTAILLIWYLVVRWIVLANTNQLSIEWLLNPSSLFVAFVSIGYLSITLFSNKRDKSYYMLTVGLFLYNIVCVGLMTYDYLKDPSIINLFYVLLDIIISSYYILNLTICYQEIFFYQKNFTKIEIERC
jgi:Zn-dependent protease with chaperone function